MNNNMKNAVKTLSEMMFDRGFIEFSHKLQADTVILDIKEVCNSNGITFIDGFTSDGKKLRIIFIIPVKWKSTDLKRYLEDDVYLALLVCRDKPTVNNIKLLKESYSSIDIQIFTFKELQINVTKHELVPKHELLGFDKEEEIQRILQLYNVKSRNFLPLILRNDPVARYFNAKPGNLMRIIRASPTSGSYELYRCCI